jgi:hypothetical protein
VLAASRDSVLSQDTRVYNVNDDVAGILYQALPSRTGMMQSMRMQSNGGCAWSTACTAAWPLSTTVQHGLTLIHLSGQRERDRLFRVYEEAPAFALTPVSLYSQT